jgi:single-strand DNA-binding protein
MYTRILILGHLTVDPSLRYTTGQGTAVCSFRVATNSVRRGPDGRQHAEYHDIVAWDRLAEPCAKALSKGSPVFVEAESRTREWTDRTGGKRQTLENHAQVVQFLPKGIPNGMLKLVGDAIDEYAKGEGVKEEDVVRLRGLIGNRTVAAQGGNEAPPPIDDAHAPKPVAPKEGEEKAEGEPKAEGDAPKDNEENAPF